MVQDFKPKISSDNHLFMPIIERHGFGDVQTTAGFTAPMLLFHFSNSVAEIFNC